MGGASVMNIVSDKSQYSDTQRFLAPQDWCFTVTNSLCFLSGLCLTLTLTDGKYNRLGALLVTDEVGGGKGMNKNRSLSYNSLLTNRRRMVAE